MEEKTKKENEKQGLIDMDLNERPKAKVIKLQGSHLGFTDTDVTTRGVSSTLTSQMSIWPRVFNDYDEIPSTSRALFEQQEIEKKLSESRGQNQSFDDGFNSTESEEVWLTEGEDDMVYDYYEGCNRVKIDESMFDRCHLDDVIDELNKSYISSKDAGFSEHFPRGEEFTKTMSSMSQLLQDLDQNFKKEDSQSVSSSGRRKIRTSCRKDKIRNHRSRYEEFYSQKKKRIPKIKDKRSKAFARYIAATEMGNKAQSSISRKSSLLINPNMESKICKMKEDFLSLLSSDDKLTILSLGDTKRVSDDKVRNEDVIANENEMMSALAEKATPKSIESEHFGDRCNASKHDKHTVNSENDFSKGSSKNCTMMTSAHQIVGKIVSELAVIGPKETKETNLIEKTTDNHIQIVDFSKNYTLVGEIIHETILAAIQLKENENIPLVLENDSFEKNFDVNVDAKNSKLKLQDTNDLSTQLKYTLKNDATPDLNVIKQDFSEQELKGGKASISLCDKIKPNGAIVCSSAIPNNVDKARSQDGRGTLPNGSDISMRISEKVSSQTSVLVSINDSRLSHAEEKIADTEPKIEKNIKPTIEVEEGTSGKKCRKQTSDVSTSVTFIDEKIKHTHESPSIEKEVKKTHGTVVDGCCVTTFFAGSEAQNNSGLTPVPHPLPQPHPHPSGPLDDKKKNDRDPHQLRVHEERIPGPGGQPFSESMSIQIETTAANASSPTVTRRPSVFARLFTMVVNFFTDIIICLHMNRDCIFCLGFFIAFLVSASFLTAFFYRNLNINPHLYQRPPIGQITVARSHPHLGQGGLARENTYIF